MDAPPAQYVKTSDGYDIAYFVAGDGPTIVRPPTYWNHISRMWSGDLLGPEFSALAERFRLVLFDGRGQGLSTRNLPETLSFDELVLDLEAVIDMVAAAPVILWGWSYASNVAIRYAVEHPERLEALILWDYIDTSNWTDPLFELAMQDWSFYVETIAGVGFSQFERTRIVSTLQDSSSQPDHVRRIRALRSFSGRGALNAVKLPTLVLAHRGVAGPTQRWPSESPGVGLLCCPTLVFG